uniref:Exocyst subunit Exo70 family protein n=1 Tax=Lactuca sativa TaxID=4236 RepID=A0A9R1UY76_LACSA|nr:hypothetical protein LSAT_V11C700358160 [Lactuca sativa]
MSRGLQLCGIREMLCTRYIPQIDRERLTHEFLDVRLHGFCLRLECESRGLRKGVMIMFSWGWAAIRGMVNWWIGFCFIGQGLCPFSFFELEGVSRIVTHDQVMFQLADNWLQGLVLDLVLEDLLKEYPEMISELCVTICGGITKTIESYRGYLYISVGGDAAGNRSGASRALVKYRLKILNGQFEELHQRQSQWTVPATELRESIRLAVVEVLLPVYRSFIKCFGALVENGKNPNKYIRYSAEDLDRMLCEFFKGKTLNKARR